MNRRQAKKNEKKAYLIFLKMDRDEDDFVEDCWMEAEAKLMTEEIPFNTNEEWDMLLGKEAFRIYKELEVAMIENTKYIKLPSRKIEINPNCGDPWYLFIFQGEYISEEGMTKTQMFDMLNDEEKSIVIFHRYFYKY
jgi:hypothetical protein